MELLDVGTHLLRPERAVEPDGDGPRVPHRVPERLDRLARERAAGEVGDRAGDHQRQPHAAFREDLLDGEERGLRVQRVEDGLDQDEVDVAVEQRLDLLPIGDAELLEVHRAETRVVHLRREGGRHRHRPDGAGDELPLTGRRRHLVGRLPGEARRGEVHVAGQLAQERVGDHGIEIRLVLPAFCVAEKEVVLPDGRRAEGVGLDDVRTGLEVVPVDLLDHLRLRDLQQFVVPLQVLALPVGEPLAAELRLAQTIPLDDGAHRPVDDGDASAEKGDDLAAPGEIFSTEGTHRILPGG